jgi:hypothetical protein
MLASSRYRIVPYTPEHRDGVARLQRNLWRGSAARNAAYLDWKYDRGPLPERSFFLLVLFDGEVVGMRGEIAMRYEGGCPRHEFVATNSADLLVDPAHRDRGLNRELASALVAGLVERSMPYSFGWSAGPRPLEWLKRTGWVEVGSLDSHWTEPATLATRVAYRAMRAAGLDGVPPLMRRYEYLRPVDARDPASALEALPDLSKSGRSGRITTASVPRPECMAELVARLGYDGRVRQVRDERWFAWRFADPFACNRFVFVDGERLEGYLVVQARSHRPIDHTAIVDLEASDPLVLRDLLDTAVQRLAIDRLVVWSASFDLGTCAALAKHGFHPVPRPKSAAEPRAALLARRLPAAEVLSSALGSRSVESIDDWDVRMAYSDAY